MSCGGIVVRSVTGILSMCQNWNCMNGTDHESYKVSGRRIRRVITIIMNSHQLCEELRYISKSEMSTTWQKVYINKLFLGDHRPVVVSKSRSSVVFDKLHVREDDVEGAIQEKPLVLRRYVIYKSKFFHRFGTRCQEGADAFLERLDLINGSPTSRTIFYILGRLRPPTLVASRNHLIKASRTKWSICAH